MSGSELDGRVTEIEMRAAEARDRNRVRGPLPAFFNPLLRAQGPVNRALAAAVEASAAAQRELGARLAELFSKIATEAERSSSRHAALCEQVTAALKAAELRQQEQADAFQGELVHLSHVNAELKKQLDQAILALQQQVEANATTVAAQAAELRRLSEISMEHQRGIERLESRTREIDASVEERLDRRAAILRMELSEPLGAVTNLLRADEARHWDSSQRLQALEERTAAAASAAMAFEKDVMQLKLEMAREESERLRLRQWLRELPQAGSDQSSPSLDSEDKGIAPADQGVLDRFYLEFENRYRGTPESVRLRLEPYLQHVFACAEGLSVADDLKVIDFGAASDSGGDSRSTRGSPDLALALRPVADIGLSIVDLGCGRGEWLALLRDHGFENQMGVDASASMIAECRKAQLNVREQDLMDFLSMLPDESVGLLTAFHVIEHLPFPVMFRLFVQALRVLVPGGLCIFETPNPENILVGSQYFYVDPTHRSPLPPDLPQFLAYHVGFAQVDVIRKEPNRDLGFEPGSLPEHHSDPGVALLMKHFSAGRDYGVLMRKEAGAPAERLSESRQ